MATIFGGYIEFENTDKLREFILTMDVQNSLKILEGALEYGVKSGVYTMEESHCIYVALTKLKESLTDEF